MTDLPSLPAWAKTLQRRIRQRGIDFFILTGPGVRDLHSLGARRFGTIGDCLAQVIVNDRSAIITYDRGAGIGFSDRDVENDFKMVLKAYDKLGGTNLAQVQPRDPDRALQLIETYLRYQLAGNPRFSAGEPLFLQRNVTFCLLAETTATLSAALVSDARTFEITVPVPDEQERHAHLAGRGSRPETFSVVDARRVAILTAGLTRLHLESLLAEAEAGGAPLDQDALTREKKRLIEEASGGLLTFMTSKVGLDAVAGHEGAKAQLRETARALSQGRLDVVPMGYLICGPVGTGKSFIVQCFAKEIGIPVVELLNFRSKWQGQTEANLERVLALLDAIGPVAVVVDEADAALGTRETGGADSGVSERVFASLAAFMGDTRRRGKVIWFLMTSRPDLVPVDLKRQGRAEEHLALFPPATVAERVQVFDRLRERLGIALEPRGDATALLGESRGPRSAADLEAILVRGSRRLAAAGETTLGAALLRELIHDFQPPSYPLELEYQRLIAAFECTSRRLLPPDLVAVPPEAIGARLAELRAALGKPA